MPKVMTVFSLFTQSIVFLFIIIFFIIFLYLLLIFYLSQFYEHLVHSKIFEF